ncbi:DoxX family protein [uncultured Psychroserpens sp.]|uniref:DoxX family protein n=1 Tax=uncultured Psychroserpens sp. TaxID=255436 RepID=UPI002637B02A|nr:DoxX family protein [uncultured Psychroserpens sp.]
MVDNSTTNSSHRALQKTFWRFVLLFLILHIVPNNLGFGFTYALDDSTFWDRPVIWFGEQLFGWDFDLEWLYRGFDSKYQLCKYIFIILLALIGTALWMLIDKYFKTNYNDKLRTFVQTALRYHLAVIMMSYGLSKVFMLQFGTLDLNGLERKIGDFGPMGLMWTFMSYSKTVVMFAGWTECIGAVLLFFRKTTFLGALVLFGVMLSVVIMDIGYDVTVAMYAIQLLLMVIVLLSSQFKNLFKFIVLGKKVASVPYKYLFKDSKFRKIALALKVLLMVSCSVLWFKEYNQRIKSQAKSAYYWFSAKHTVETFILNGDTIPVSNEDHPKLWKTITFDDSFYFPETFALEKTSIRPFRFNYEVDSISQTIRYNTAKPNFIGNDNEDEEDQTDLEWQTINYKELEDKVFEFETIFEGDTIYAKTKVKRFEDYILIRNSGHFLFD